MRIPTAPERRVLLLQRAAALLFGPLGSVRYLHTHNPTLGTTPAAAAWAGGELARQAGEALREIALQVSATTGKRPGRGGPNPCILRTVRVFPRPR